MSAKAGYLAFHLCFFLHESLHYFTLYKRVVDYHFMVVNKYLNIVADHENLRVRLAGAEEFLQEAGNVPVVPLWEAELDPLNQCPGVHPKVGQDQLRP